MKNTPTRVLLMFAALVLFIVPVVAFAAAGFTDVDDDNVFVADIEWMKDNGITKGCNPPANDKFCPENNVTRQQMSAFMHRLATKKVVDAATAVDADNAADAELLDGKDSTALMSIAGSAVLDTFSVTGGGPAEVVVSLTGFDVPAGGGVITATVTSSYVIDAAQLGLVWTVVDGTCDDTLSDGGVGLYLSDELSAPIGEVSSSIAASVGAGAHRVDVCTLGLVAVGTELLNTRLNVVWSPVASGAGVASSSGTTIEDLISRYSELLES